MTDDDLKYIADGLIVDQDPENLSIAEVLWDQHPDPESVSDDEWEDLRARVRELCSTAIITVEWPDD